jgi:GntR family transcriptional regulator/MocR family aminotransferase
MVVQVLPFRTLLFVDKNSSLAVYKQIANGMIQLIREGMLKPGSKIPPTRQMAVLLQLHRKTIIAAYDELVAQDWVTAMPRKGMMVSARLPEVKPRTFKANMNVDPYAAKTESFYRKIIEAQPNPNLLERSYRLTINDGFPDARIAPIDSLLKQYRVFLKKSHMQGLFMSSDAAGAYSLRCEIASFLSKTRAIQIESSNVLITRGAQAAIFIAARMVLKPGSTVIVGAPNYLFANNVFKHMGAKLIKVNVDEHGIDVDAIEKICKKKRPDLLYIIPHHHHPTTVTLSAQRRMQLLDLIRAYQLPVIEDDYDYDFHYNKSPILPLASADHGGYVLYIGSVTKSFASAIRIGYLVGSAAFVQQAAGLREMIEIRGDVLMEEAMAVLYKNGDMQKHVHKAVKLYQERRDFFCNLLSNELGDMVHYQKPSGGMSVWVTFNEPYELPKIAAGVAKSGIRMNDGQLYNTENVNYNALRMGFASMNESEMVDVVSCIKKLK